MATTNLILNPETLRIKKGENATISVEHNATDYQVVSKNPDQASVSKTGNTITVNALQETTNVDIEVTATAEGGEEVKKVCRVEIYEVVETSLEVNPTTAEVKVGENVEISVVHNAADYNVVSKDTGKVGVQKQPNKAILTGKAPGTGVQVAFDATAKNGQKVTKIVTVNVKEATPPPKVETELSVTPTEGNVKVDSTLELTVTHNAESYSVESSDVKKATVKKQGSKVIVTGKSPGSVTIRIKATKQGATEKMVTVNLNVQAKSEGGETMADAREIYLGSEWAVKGQMGEVVKLVFPKEEEPKSLSIFSKDTCVAYANSAKKEITLSNIGTTTLVLSMIKEKEGKDVAETKTIPVYVIQATKERKMDYTKEGVRDYFISNMLLESGFIYGTPDEPLLVCQLDKESEAGKALMGRGVKEAKLEIVDIVTGSVLIKITTQSDRGVQNTETGKFEESKPIETVIAQPFFAGAMNKKDVIKIYRKFQELVRDAYNR